MNNAIQTQDIFDSNLRELKLMLTSYNMIVICLPENAGVDLTEKPIAFLSDCIDIFLIF